MTRAAMQPYAATPPLDISDSSTTGDGVARGFCDAVITIAIGTASIAFVTLLHAVSPMLAIAIQALIACAVVAAVPGHAPAITVFILLFQNMFVSILSPYIADPSSLEFIKGYNFLNCSVMWLAAFANYITRYRDYPATLTRLMIQSTAVLAVIGIYFLAGLLRDPLAASIYLRNIVLPIFLFQLALLSTPKHPVPLTPVLVAISVLFISCGYVELVFRDFWLAATNGKAYWYFDEIKKTASGLWEREMRVTGQVDVELTDRFAFDFLNTPLLAGFGLSKILRVFGPNISAISFAYGVAFFVLFLFSVGRWWLAIAAIPLVVFCGVKGALITILFVLIAWATTCVFGALLTLAVGLIGLAGYVAVGIIIGLQIGDYHVLGFMGGLNGFLEAPWGRGLGDGGNLSDDFSAIDWTVAQQAGAVAGAVESAVGVLMYQMGLAALAPLGFYVAVAIRAWRLYAVSGILTQGLAAFGILVVLVNGVFQEEALFAPPALGLMVLLAGLVIGNALRNEPAAMKVARCERSWA